MFATLLLASTLILGSNSVQRQVDLAPPLGAVAPPVVAVALDGTAKFDMSVNKGKRPTVLVFGSCT